MSTPQERSKELRLNILDSLDKRAKTRAELCAEFKIPRTTIWNNLEKLEKDGFVESFDVNTNTKGRRPKKWKRKKHSVSLT
jgi:predicted ArsR family transcriptional regulator